MPENNSKVPDWMKANMDSIAYEKRLSGDLLPGYSRLLDGTLRGSIIQNTVPLAQQQELRERFKDQGVHFAVYGGRQVVAYLISDMRNSIANSERHSFDEMVALITEALERTEK